MKIILRMVASAGLVALLLFCTFGFLATFEPLSPAVQWTWRVVYAGVAVLDVVGFYLVWRPAKRPSPSSR